MKKRGVPDAGGVVVRRAAAGRKSGVGLETLQAKYKRRAVLGEVTGLAQNREFEKGDDWQVEESNEGRRTKRKSGLEALDRSPSLSPDAPPHNDARTALAPPMLFCPNCANLLVISAQTGANKWVCNSCPYEFPITKQVSVFSESMTSCPAKLGSVNTAHRAHEDKDKGARRHARSRVPYRRNNRECARALSSSTALLTAFCSRVSQMRAHESFLQHDADTLSRRANDHM